MNEQQRLSDAVDEFATAMKARLESKRKQGWRGWETPEFFNAKNRLLNNAAQAFVTGDKKSLVDVANLAMMLWRE